MAEPAGGPTLVVAGGGTGGHVLAGVAIADAWRASRGGRVVFVGARGGIEERLVPRAGYPLELLSLGALKGVSLGRRLVTLARLPFSFWRSASILLRERPAAVVGVGGYAAGPLVLTARLIGRFWGGSRVAILEQNAVPGFTNRVLARFAHRVFVAFAGMEGAFPGGKAAVSGNPVRKQIRPMAPAAREPFVLFVFGGSQGAMGINTLVLGALPLLADLKDRLRIIHQTGERDYGRVAEGYAFAGWLRQVKVEKFIHEMPEAYAQASLVVCRAGSSTLAELAAVGRASVLVPFPFASDNHQEKNARIFERGGAARVLLQQASKPGDQASREARRDSEDLARLVRELMGDPARLGAMEAAARVFYRPEAAKAVADGVMVAEGSA